MIGCRLSGSRSKAFRIVFSTFAGIASLSWRGVEKLERSSWRFKISSGVSLPNGFWPVSDSGNRPVADLRARVKRTFAG